MVGHTGLGLSEDVGAGEEDSQDFSLWSTDEASRRNGLGQWPSPCMGHSILGESIESLGPLSRKII